MPATAPRPVAQEEQTSDFFSMFYLPSSQSYDEDVLVSTSTYTPFQGAVSAASAMVGGIISAIDSALAVMNEEFEHTSDIMISESTKDDEEEIQSGGPRVASKSSAIRCCRKKSRSSPSARGDTERSFTANEDKVSHNTERYAHYESENDVHNMSIVQSSSQEKDYFTPQNSLIGSIPTLQLYEEGTGEITKPLISKSHLESKRDGHVEIESNTETGSKDVMCPESGISKNEDSEYCFVRNESETNDGWLVVSDD